MADVFTATWQAAFGWLASLMTMNLPIYWGDSPLSFLDIIIGTIGIIVTFSLIRAIFKSGFSIAGKDLVAERKHQDKIRSLNAQEKTRLANRQLYQNELDGH